jgi:signal transduction histidine kinase
MPDSGSGLPREALEALVDRAPMMVAILDEHGRVTWANRELGRVLALAPGALPGLRFVDLALDADDREHAGRLLAGAEGVSVTFRMRRGDGGAAQTTWTTIRPAGGPIVAIGRDVSEERELASRLARAERLEAIGRLAGGIAHDFNNLLTIIGGNAQLLVELRELTGPAYDEAEEIVRAADTARAVVRQLLTFTGRAPQPTRAVDVNERIDNLREIVDRLIDAPVKVAFELGNGLPHVRLEEGQLEQVVINLLLNARDAMPGGGDVQVRTDLAAIGQEGASVMSGRIAPGRYVRLVVADTGVGIERETLERILEPFFTTKANTGGTGLGLSTVHAIVRQAGGHLDIVSAPGKGSAFAIYLPAAASGEAAAEQSAVPAPVPPAVILVVDDHDAIRAVCRRALESDGHRVLEAASVDAAIEVSRAQDRLDLVVADARLRGENGGTLRRALGAGRPEVRMLLMSGHHVDAGDAGVLEKPFTAAALVAAVRKALAPGQPPTANR